VFRVVEGILDINTVEHRVPGGDSIRGFLPITSLASHSCLSNSIKDKLNPGWVTTRARIPVKKGEEITFHYTGGLKGRFMRRPALRRGWCFWCGCPRCSSPSELGSELSSLICSQPACSGIVRPTDPLDQESVYRCSKCEEEISSVEAETREKKLTEKLENCYSNDTETILKLYESSTGFHTNHFLKLIMKWLLIQAWGKEPGFETKNLGEKLLEKKVVFCQEYLAALDILDPGISHNRGLTLWELHSAKTFLINKRFREDKVSAMKFLEELKDSLAIVREAAYCLQFNQVRTAEYKVRTLSLAAEENLQKAIQFFSSVLPDQ